MLRVSEVELVPPLELRPFEPVYSTNALEFDETVLAEPVAEARRSVSFSM